jgi:hypothetical protein
MTQTPAVDVVLLVRGGGLWGVDVQQLDRVDGELLKIGALTAAGGCT